MVCFAIIIDHELLSEDLIVKGQIVFCIVLVLLANLCPKVFTIVSKVRVNYKIETIYWHAFFNHVLILYVLNKLSKYMC